MRILLIEDDPGLCDSLSYQLQEAGYVVDICQDGEDAFYYLEQKIYDLVLLDRMLPHTDGLTILKKMRAGKDCTPVIFLTALGELEEKVTGLEAGADDYLVKPFAFAELEAGRPALSLRRPDLLRRGKSPDRPGRPLYALEKRGRAFGISSAKPLPDVAAPDASHESMGSGRGSGGRKLRQLHVFCKTPAGWGKLPGKD